MMAANKRQLAKIESQSDEVPVSPLGKARRRLSKNSDSADSSQIVLHDKMPIGHVKIIAKQLIPVVKEYYGDDPPVPDDIRFACQYNGICRFYDFWNAYALLWLCDIGWALPTNWYRMHGHDCPGKVALSGLRFEFARQLHLAGHTGISRDEFSEIVGREISGNYFNRLALEFKDRVAPIIECYRRPIDMFDGPLAYRILPGKNYFVIVDVEKGLIDDVDWDSFTIPFPSKQGFNQ